MPKPSYRTPSEAPAQTLGRNEKMPGETSTPATVVAAVAQDPMLPMTTQPSASAYEGTYATEEEAPRMIPVDQIRIPESDTEEAAAAADDDDVIVAVPAPSGGSARRSRSSTSGSRRRR